MYEGVSLVNPELFGQVPVFNVTCHQSLYNQAVITDWGIKAGRVCEKTFDTLLIQYVVAMRLPSTHI